MRAVLRAEGPCLVLGGAGLGKSMLSQLIEFELESRFDVINLHASGLCSRRALLQAILFELQMPYRALSEGELRMSIMDRMMPSPETAPDGLLIIVDEAHTLSAKLLEELRLITNFARNGQPRARLVMIGNMRLEDTFANPQMDSFNQRIAVRCYLQPMSREQTAEFVRHQLKCLQINPANIITNDGLKALYAASEGVPRIVNQVMDHALVLGITNGQCPISASLIEEAWSDLQQLPAPWHTIEQQAVQANTESSPIEFGSLSDEDEVAFETRGEINETTTSTNARSAYSDSDDADIEDAEASARGFFAAFSDESAEGVRKYMEGIESDALIEPTGYAQPSLPIQPPVTSEEQPTQSGPSATPRVVFDASRAFGNKRHSVAYPRELAPAPATQGPAPTADVRSKDVRFPQISPQFSSDEQLIQAIDAQGLWADDPPITVSANANRSSALPAAIPSESKEIFGEDFEEEIPLEISGTAGRVRQIFEPQHIQDLNQAARNEERIAQEVYRDSARASQAFAPSGTKGSPQPDSPQPISPMMTSNESLVANWTVDVNVSEPEREAALQVEIEDLVSQLNFSAFAVEPYSVEQIEVDFLRSPASANKFGTSKAAADDMNEREAIYTLHTRSSDKADDIHSNLNIDDDRDLLIIEEELPVSSRGATESIGAPIVKSTPYSQLFAKLRH